jgi:hypothetical protein
MGVLVETCQWARCTTTDGPMHTARPLFPDLSLSPVEAVVCPRHAQQLQLLPNWVMLEAPIEQHTCGPPGEELTELIKRTIDWHLYELIAGLANDLATCDEPGDEMPIGKDCARALVGLVAPDLLPPVDDADGEANSDDQPGAGSGLTVAAPHLKAQS